MVYKNINRMVGGGEQRGFQQNPIPLPLGSRNSPTKSAPHLLVAAHYHICSDVEEYTVVSGGVGSLDRELMVLLARKHLDSGIAASTYRVPFPG